MKELLDKNAVIEGKLLSIKDGTEGEHDPKKRRDIIKTILIIFLAVMLILTFFSNTIMNRSLAEISTESVTSGKLTERIRGSGMVESNQMYEVKTDGNRTIDTIMIKTGKEVKKGDVLFTVGKGESDELTEAQSTLDTLTLEYQKALLVLPDDYSAENQAIQNAQADLNAAIAKRDAAVANSGNASAALAQYNQNKTDLNSQTAVQGKLEATISAIDTDDYSSASVEYTGNLPALFNTYSSAEAAYTTAYSIYTAAVEDGGDAATAKADADAKAEVRDAAKTAYDNEKSVVRSDLVTKLAAAEAEVSRLTAAVAEYENNAGTEGGMSVDELNADVDAKQRALSELVIALNKTKNENNLNNQKNNLELEAQKAAIDAQKKKVEKLKKECETTEIKSVYDGVVTSVNIQPGEMTVPDTALAVIDISSEGYRVEISVDGEKAKKIKKGASAEVVNNWNGDVQALLTDIKNDTVSGSKNRILVFDVTGDVDSGTSIDLSIPCGSANYDAIVPKSAVFEDKNGKFVLTVKSKSSPLGNRYFAERVSVEVLASDETSSAVSGGVMQSDYVITASSKPVAPGDQVRMKD